MTDNLYKLPGSTAKRIETLTFKGPETFAQFTLCLHSYRISKSHNEN